MESRVENSTCPWWKGCVSLTSLRTWELAVVMGKIESGTICEGDSLLVMPNKVHVKIIAIYCDEIKVRRSGPGENVLVRLTGIEEEDILSGFVLSSIVNPVVSTPSCRLSNCRTMQILLLATRQCYTFILWLRNVR